MLGCVVNGPGEARETDIGITGGGKGKHMVYLSGVTDHHVQDADMIDHIVKLVEAKAAELDAEADQQTSTPPNNRARMVWGSSTPLWLGFFNQIRRITAPCSSWC